MAATRRKARTKKTKTPPTAAKAGLFSTLARSVKTFASGIVTRTKKKKKKKTAAKKPTTRRRRKKKAPAAT